MIPSCECVVVGVIDRGVIVSPRLVTPCLNIIVVQRSYNKLDIRNTTANEVAILSRRYLLQCKKVSAHKM